MSADLSPAPAPPRRRWPLFAGLAVLAIIAGVGVFWPRPQGTIRFENVDPKIEIVFDKTGPTVTGVAMMPIALSAGEHDVLVKRGDDFTFATDKILITKGETRTLKIKVEHGQMQFELDGVLIGAKDFVPGEDRVALNGKTLAEAIGLGKVPAPSLITAQELFHDHFADTSKNWVAMTGKSHQQGYAAGKYFIRLDPETEWGCFCPVKEPFADFACEVVGRIAGTADAHWFLNLINGEEQKSLQFKLNGKQKLEVVTDLEGANIAQVIKSAQHSAIKAGEEFNRLLVIARDQRYEVYVNGVLVCEPVATDYIKLPCWLALVAVSPENKGARAEFAEFTVLSAASLPTLEQRLGK